MWIADLVACGLIRASFVPVERLQQLRSLMRTRKQFSREQTRHVQRIHKTLERPTSILARDLRPHGREWSAHPAGLAHIPKLLGQLQQTHLHPNNLLFLRHRPGLPCRPQGGSRSQLGVRTATRPPASVFENQH
jgi:hypothetical protein